jgi:hypothetical protein
MKAPMKKTRPAAEEGKAGRAAPSGIISRELQERAERAARELKQASQVSRKSHPSEGG